MIKIELFFEEFNLEKPKVFYCKEYNMSLYQIYGVQRYPKVSIANQTTLKNNKYGEAYITLYDNQNKPAITTWGTFSRASLAFKNENFDLILEGNNLPYFDQKELNIFHKYLNPLPNQRDHWYILSPNDRFIWLDICAKDQRKIQKPDKIGNTYQINGLIISDLSSFLCAFGEAINGIAGYMGKSIDSLEDCMLGGFGYAKSGILVWMNFDKSNENFLKVNNKYLLDELLLILQKYGMHIIFS